MRSGVWNWIWVGVVGCAAWGESVWELSPYTVEAWHFDQLGRTVPAEVFRVDGQRIRESGAAGVPEVLEQLAGVRFRGLTGNGTEGQVALRGFGENSGLRVLILVDGQVYNPPDMGGINWTGLSVEELETVEVIRGGQGVLYGNHAVSGVVKLRTRDPSNELAGTLRARTGSDGTRGVSGSFENRISSLGIRAGVHRQSTDGYRDNARAETGSGYVTWRHSGRGDTVWRGRFQLNRHETQFPGPLLFEEFEEDPRQSTHAGRDRSDRDVMQATLYGEGVFEPVEWELNAGFLERQTGWNLDGSEGENRLQRLTASPRLKTTFGNGFVVTGIDLIRDSLDTREFYGPDASTTKARADLDRTTAGLYFLVSRDICERFTLSGGFRRELARTDNDYLHLKTEQLLPFIETNRGAVSNPDYRDPPEADPDLSFSGVVEKSGWAAEFSGTFVISESLSVWAGWDRVYRYPSVDETASFQGYPLASPLNVELQPETGANLETGIKLTGENWQIGWTLFRMLMEDEIVFDEDARLNVNLGATERRGLELSGGIHREMWGASGNFSWLSAEFDDRRLAYHGSRIPLVPELEAGISLWRSLPGNLRLRGHVRYVDRQHQGNDFENRRRLISDHALMSLYLRWTPTGDLVLGIGVENLMDKQYATSAYNGGFYPGPGRRIHADLTCRF